MGLELVKNYLRRKKVSILKKEEVYELVTKAQAGDKASRDKLIIHNLPSVMQLASKVGYEARGVLDYDDLFQEGVLGLIRAIEKFDVKRNLELSTYAFFWIKQKMGRYCDDNRGTVRVPIYLQGLKRKYQKLSKDNNKYNDDFYMRLVAEQNDSTVSTLRYAISQQGETHLDKINEDGNYFELGNIVDEHEIDINLLDVKVMLAKIGGTDREIIERRMEGWTFKKLAEEMDLSRERIRQLEESAILKLHAMIANVKENKIFRLRYQLSDEFKGHLSSMIKNKEIKDPLKIDSSSSYSPIIGVCSECMFEALRNSENAAKFQQGQPNWVRASCDICGKIKPCANPKDFMFPTFVITADKRLI